MDPLQTDQDQNDEMNQSHEFPINFWSSPTPQKSEKLPEDGETRKIGETTPGLPEIDVWKAVREGNLTLVQQAITQGFDVSTGDSEGRTIFHICASLDSEHHIQLLTYLSSNFHEVVNIQNKAGESPLHMAAKHLNLEAVIMLLKNKAIVNLLNSKGQTPLDLSPPIRNLMLEHISTPPAWIEDIAAPFCQLCADKFTFINRRHHCRHCGRVICGSCSAGELPIEKFQVRERVRLCSHCKPIVLQSNMVHQVKTSP